jgi:hypothetical protein
MGTFNLQAEIDAQITAGGLGGIVDLPTGEIPISNTINIQQVRGLVIRGKGAIATDLRWVGTGDLPMFRFNRTQGCFLERVSITARTGSPLLEGLRIEHGAVDNSNPKHWANLASSLLTVRDVIFRGQATTASSGFRYPAARTRDLSSKVETLRRSTSIRLSCPAQSPTWRSADMGSLH